MRRPVSETKAFNTLVRHTDELKLKILLPAQCLSMLESANDAHGMKYQISLLLKL